MRLCSEFGNPKRKFCENLKEIKEYVKLYNGKTNCYKTVYGFEQYFPSQYRNVPNYDTAIIDKVYMDFDGKETFDEVKRVHEMYLKDDIKHIINFSGNGFHILVYTDKTHIVNKQPALHRYCDEISMLMDQKVVNDQVGRLYRIIYTLHIDKKRYCIPLCEDDLKLTWKEICEKSKTLNGIKREVFGREVISLERLDYPEEDGEFGNNTIDLDGLEINIDTSQLDAEIFPKCALIPMKKEHPRFYERMVYFTFMRSCGFSLKTAKKAVRRTWKEPELTHSFNEEKQADKIYANEVSFPSRYKIASNGYCYGCKLCEPKTVEELEKELNDGK